MQASLNLKLRKGVRTLRRINNTLASEHFSDGIAYLYQLRSDGEPDEGSRIRRFFGERNITYKRIAEARQIMTEYSRIIGTGSVCEHTLRPHRRQAVQGGDGSGDIHCCASRGCDGTV